MSYLTFPLPIGNLSQINFLIIEQDSQVTLTDEGKVIRQLKQQGVTDKQINRMTNKFAVSYCDGKLSITTNRSELKMAKDKILQVILLLNSQ